MQKKLLVIGAGPDQVPAIQMARAMGHQIYATDANPSAPGFALADGHALVSTNDAAGTLAYAQNLRPDGIFTLASETGVPTVAATAEALGLPGIGRQCAYLATNKNAMREAFKTYGVPTTASARLATMAELQDFLADHPLPLVLKPSDCSGQRGTSKLETAEQAEAALAAALHFSTDGRAIVESFAPGPEINVTAVIQNGQVSFLSFSDRITAEPPHFGIAIEHAAPLEIEESSLAVLRAAAEASIHAIGLKNGVAYPQIILSPTGPRVLEIAARIPGGYMREVALLMSGVDLIEIVIRQSLGEDFALEALRGERHPAANVKFITELDTAPAGSKIISIDGLESARSAPGIFAVHLGMEANSTIPPLNSSAARFGAVISTGGSRNEARSRAQVAAQSIRLSCA